MALREERPADFTDEERWGAHWLSTPVLIAGLVLISVSVLICKACAALHILPIGIVLSFILIVPGTVIFILPVPEGDLWHGQGTMAAKILARLLVHAAKSGILVRHMSLMGEDAELSCTKGRKAKRRRGKKSRKAAQEKGVVS